MRVVIAEDLYLLREGLVRLLEAYDFEIVAAVGTAPELREALVAHKPDIGIVDVRLPPTNTDDGLRAAIAARKEVAGLPVLVLSQYVERLYARELLADQAGGVGYLLKDRVFNDEAFLGAIRTVAAGGTVLDPEVVRKLIAREKRTQRLTPRELQVLELMAQGRSNAAIAQKLRVSEKAVSKHAAGIFAKLGLLQSDDDNRRVLAVLAYLESLAMFRRYAFTWCYLGLFVLMELVQALLSPTAQTALIRWASTSVANLEHHPVGCLVASAFAGTGDRVAWPVLIAVALLAASRAVGNMRALLVCLAGQLVGTLVSEGIVAYRVDAGHLPVADRHLIDVGPSYVVVAAIMVALVCGTWLPRLAAAVVFAILVFGGDIFGGLSTLQVAAVGHLTAVAVGLACAIPMAAGGLSRRRGRRRGRSGT